MRVLLNYEKEDKPRLQIVANMLKNYGVTNAAATSSTLEISSLLSKARETTSDAILIANTETLNHCVAGAKATLDNFRGTRLNFSIPAIVLNSFSHIHAFPHGRWVLEQDLSKLQKIKDPVQPFTFKILDNPFEFDSAIEVLGNSEFIVFDVETIPIAHGLMTSISYSAYMANGTWKNFVVPMIDFTQLHYKTDAEFGLALQFIRAVSALPQVKVAHNGIYDCQYLIKYRAPPHNFVLDTMLLWHAWYASLDKDLSYVASILLYDYYQWKNESAMAKQNKDLMTALSYNAKDTWYTGRILLKLLEHMPSFAITNYKNSFEKVYPAIYCNFEGFLVDWDRHKELKEVEVNKLEKSLNELQIMAADPNFNPGSPKQVGEFLFDIIGAKKTKTRGAGGKWVESNSTNEKSLNKIAAQHPLLARLAGSILEYRKAAKAIGTYFNFEPYNDRVMWSIIVGGTETERFACSQSAFFCGLQVQNVPSKDSKAHINAKGFMRADPGYVLVELDENKSEARCVAYLAKCLKLIEALETPDKDFYKILATIFFGLTYENVSKDLRNNVVKRIIHGTNYMMQEDTFIDTATPVRLYEAAALLGMTVTDMRKFAGYLLGIYHEKFPEVGEHYEEIKNEIRMTGKLVSPLGHTRLFFGNIDKDNKLLRSAVAHEPQNLSVDIINKGFVRIFYELILASKGDIRLKAQIHDSILVQVKKHLLMEYVERAYELTEYPVQVHGRTLRIPRDFKIGEYWDEMEEVKYDPATKQLIS